MAHRARRRPSWKLHKKLAHPSRKPVAGGTSARAAAGPARRRGKAEPAQA